MSPRDWQQISAMTHDHNLYQNLVQSMFPTIHGVHYMGMNCMASSYPQAMTSVSVEFS